MALINFKDIDFNKSISKENKVIDFNGSEIQIINYLPVQDKYDLIMVTVQKSKEKNMYNPFLIDLYFDLNVIYLYTNIIFNAEDRAEEAGLYDTLKKSGLIDEVKKNIDNDELELLKFYVEAVANYSVQYSNTFKGSVEELLEKLPKDLGGLAELIKNMPPELMEKLGAMNNSTHKPITE